MSPSLEFLETLRPKRENFVATMTPEEKAVMGAHFAYNDRLFAEGKILIGGAATDGSIGIIVLRVGSAEEAREIRLSHQGQEEERGISLSRSTRMIPP